MAVLEIRMLGRFEVRRDGEPVPIPSRAAQSLFAYLLLNPGVSHRRERLAGLLDPESPDEDARKTLRYVLWRLRKALGPDPLTGRDYFLADEMTVSLDPAVPYSLDVSDLIVPATSRIEDLVASVSVYGGDLLPGFYEDWAQIERARLEASFENKIRLLLDRLVQEARWDDVLAWAEHWISRGGTPEAAYRALMLAHAAQGDSALAAAAYRRCEEALRTELGVEPGAATRELYQRLARGEAIPGLPAVSALPGRIGAPPADTHAAPAAEAPAAGEPPFKGLQYFDTADADIYFGRETLTERLVARLRERPVLAVVGASGSGKSSLVRAGLVSALAVGALPASHSPARPGSRAWAYHVITPTAHPLQALALALTRDSESVTAATTLADDMVQDARSLSFFAAREARPGDGTPACHIFLAVDQFEELFTLCRSEAERAAFVANLLAAAPPDALPFEASLTVVLALRADFYAHCAEYPELREALATCQEYIGAMTPAELRRAIECPAEAGGWIFEPGLVDALLHDAGNEPGALPLLSHALLETWERRRGRTLTLAGYAASGRVAGGIARTAQSTYAALTPEEQAVARHIFLRLTELGEDTPDTRRRARLRELYGETRTRPLVDAVLDILADARLVTLGDDQAEVAHEALIREWPLLREWLAEDREGLRVHRRLTESAQSWEASGRDAGELYRGARLARAAEWRLGHDADLNGLEREFLAASQGAAEREAAEHAAQQARELAAAQQLAAAESRRAAEHAEASQRIRRGARFLAAALVLALALGAAAGVLAARARQSAALATVHELATAAGANLYPDPQRGLLLAIEAAERAQAAGGAVPANVEEALHRAIQANRLRATVKGEAGASVSGDAVLAATAASGGAISVWPLSAWSAAGEPSGEPLAVLDGSPGLRTLTFSPNHLTLAEADQSGDITLWDTGSGQVRAVLLGHSGPVARIIFAEGAPRVAALGEDGTARLWNADTGAELLTLGRDAPIAWIDLSRQRGELAVAAVAGGVEIWDTDARGRIAEISAAEVGVVRRFAFCGRERLAVLTFDGVELWGDEGRVPQQGLEGVGPLPLVALACNFDGTRLAVGGAAVPLQSWDVVAGSKTGIAAAGYGTGDAAYSPDGALLMTSGAASTGGQTVQVWEAAAGTEVAAYAEPAFTWQMSISPRADLVATSTDGYLNVWSVPRFAGGGSGGASPRAPLVHKPLHGGIMGGVAFSPDGRLLATSGWDRRLLLWDAPSMAVGKPLTVLTPEVLQRDEPGLEYNLWGLAFDDAGRRLLEVRAGRSYNAALKVWELAGAEVAAVPLHHAEDTSLSLIPNAIAIRGDGGEVAVGLADGVVQVVGVESGPPRWVIQAHDGAVSSLAYSPDGARLASAGEDGRIRVWALKPGGDGASDAIEQVYELRPHGSGYTSVAFTPDGARLASGGADGTVRLWDAATGRGLLILSQSEGPILRLAISADGAGLAAVSSDAVRMYALGLPEVLGLARGRLTRALTFAERVEFLREEEQPPPAADMPAAAPVRAPEEVVRALAAAWTQGDVNGVGALFADDAVSALDVMSDLDMSLAYRTAITCYARFHIEGVPGEMRVAGCTQGIGGSLECYLTYRNACTEAVAGGPLQLRTTFTIDQGKIRTAWSANAKSETGRPFSSSSVLAWGAGKAQADYRTYDDWAGSWNEGAAAGAGRAFLGMCLGYAAEQKAQAATPAP